MKPLPTPVAESIAETKTEPQVTVPTSSETEQQQASSVVSPTSVSSRLGSKRPSQITTSASLLAAEKDKKEVSEAAASLADTMAAIEDGV